MATISLPTPLRPYAGKQSELAVEGATIRELLHNLTAAHPDLRRHLFSDDGVLRNFVNIYVNDEDIRYLQQGDTPLTAADQISIIPSIAGGAG